MLLRHLGASRQEDLIALGVDDARPRLIACLELNLALESLDLLLVQEVAVLVPVLDTLLGVHKALVGWDSRARDEGLSFLDLRLLSINDRNLSLLSARYWRLSRGWLLSVGGLLRSLRSNCSGRQRVVCVVLSRWAKR